MIYELENEKLIIAVSEVGAELVRIYDKENEREVLWNGDERYWKRHAPVLFPNVGRNYHDQYLYKGNTYPTKQHGFARDAVFQLVEQCDNKIVFRMEDTKETKKVFPFAFSLEITHVLVENSIIVEWKVTNKGNEIMYFTIGGHPAFQVPAEEGKNQTDYKLLFGDLQEPEYVLIDHQTGSAVTSQIYQLKTEDGVCPITKDFFKKDALIFDNGQIKWAAIGHPDGSPYVSMQAEGFTNFGIWSPPAGAPFICLEPWAGRCDNMGFQHDISCKPDVNALAAGECLDKEYTITIH